MADRLKKAAVWLGLVSDNDYVEPEPGTDDVTEQVMASGEVAPTRPASATVTELETRRPAKDHQRVADISRIITVHPRT
jgi:cell division inhibitor SepF